MVEIALSGLSHEFDGREVFRGLDFACDRPCLAVIGPNGSGKSTLLRIIAGLLTPVSGKVSVSVEGVVIGCDDLRGVVGLCAPDARLYPELSARENLTFLVRVRGNVGGEGFHPLPNPPPHRGREQARPSPPPQGGREQNEPISNAIARVGLTSRADDLISELSSGLRQRAALAAALVHRPKLLLLDEPMINLDEDGIRLAGEIIHAQRDSGMVVFTATDPSAAEIADARLDLGGAR